MPSYDTYMLLTKLTKPITLLGNITPFFFGQVCQSIKMPVDKNILDLVENFLNE